MRPLAFGILHFAFAIAAAAAVIGTLSKPGAYMLDHLITWGWRLSEGRFYRRTLIIWGTHLIIWGTPLIIWGSSDADAAFIRP